MKVLNWLKVGMTASVAALAAFIGATQPAHANAVLAKSKNCMACHAVDKKLLGPAFSAVADKYAGKKDAEDMLVQSIVKGSKGTWGAVPMPPNAHVSEGEARTLARWIQSGPK